MSDLSLRGIEWGMGEMSEMRNLAFSNIKGMPLLIAPFTYTFIHNGGKKLNKNKTSPKQPTHWFVTKTRIHSPKSHNHLVSETS
jgi:hypothetical protein